MAPYSIVFFFFLGTACQFRFILLANFGDFEFYCNVRICYFPIKTSISDALNGIAFFHDSPDRRALQFEFHFKFDSIYSAVGCRPNSSTDFRWILMELVTCRCMNRFLPPWAPCHQGTHGRFINFEFTNCDLSVVGWMCAVRVCICAYGKCNQFYCVHDSGQWPGLVRPRQHPQSCLLGRN